MMELKLEGFTLREDRVFDHLDESAALLVQAAVDRDFLRLVIDRQIALGLHGNHLPHPSCRRTAAE